MEKIAINERATDVRQNQVTAERAGSQYAVIQEQLRPVAAVSCDGCN